MRGRRAYVPSTLSKNLYKNQNKVKKDIKSENLYVF